LRRSNLEVIDFVRTEIASLRSQRRQKDFFRNLLKNICAAMFGDTCRSVPLLERCKIARERQADIINGIIIHVPDLFGAEVDPGVDDPDHGFPLFQGKEEPRRNDSERLLVGDGSRQGRSSFSLGKKVCSSGRPSKSFSLEPKWAEEGEPGHPASRTISRLVAPGIPYPKRPSGQPAGALPLSARRLHHHGM
jgi:hypothetical protein